MIEDHIRALTNKQHKNIFEIFLTARGGEFQNNKEFKRQAENNLHLLFSLELPDNDLIKYINIANIIISNETNHSSCSKLMIAAAIFNALLVSGKVSTDKVTEELNEAQVFSAEDQIRVALFLFYYNLPSAYAPKRLINNTTISLKIADIYIALNTIFRDVTPFINMIDLKALNRETRLNFLLRIFIDCSLLPEYEFDEINAPMILENFNNGFSYYTNNVRFWQQLFYALSFFDDIQAQFSSMPDGFLKNHLANQSPFILKLSCIESMFRCSASDPINFLMLGCLLKGINITQVTDAIKVRLINLARPLRKRFNKNELEILEFFSFKYFLALHFHFAATQHNDMYLFLCLGILPNLIENFFGDRMLTPLVEHISVIAVRHSVQLPDRGWLDAYIALKILIHSNFNDTKLYELVAKLRKLSRFNIASLSYQIDFYYIGNTEGTLGLKVKALLIVLNYLSHGSTTHLKFSIDAIKRYAKQAVEDIQSFEQKLRSEMHSLFAEYPPEEVNTAQQHNLHFIRRNSVAVVTDIENKIATELKLYRALRTHVNLFAILAVLERDKELGIANLKETLSAIQVESQSPLVCYIFYKLIKLNKFKNIDLPQLIPTLPLFFQGACRIYSYDLDKIKMFCLREALHASYMFNDIWEEIAQELFKGTELALFFTQDADMNMLKLRLGSDDNLKYYNNGKVSTAFYSCQVKLLQANQYDCDYSLRALKLLQAGVHAGFKLTMLPDEIYVTLKQVLRGWPACRSNISTVALRSQLISSITSEEAVAKSTAHLVASSRYPSETSTGPQCPTVKRGRGFDDANTTHLKPK